MKIDINWLAVVLATVASMVIAGAWYADFAFGKPWKKLTRVDTKKAEQTVKTSMTVVLIINFLTAVVIAAAVSVVSNYFGNSSVWVSLVTGLVLWLAFSAPTLLTHNMFEQKPMKLTNINNGYQLALFAVMALIIGLL